MGNSSGQFVWFELIGVPSLGQAGTGAEPWQRRLFERLRLQNYAWRVADFIRPRH